MLYQLSYFRKCRISLKLRKVATLSSESSGLDCYDFFAEDVGFEPTVHCCTLVFKTSAFDHSANLPIEQSLGCVVLLTVTYFYPCRGVLNFLPALCWGGGTRTPKVVRRRSYSPLSQPIAQPPIFVNPEGFESSTVSLEG